MRRRRDDRGSALVEMTWLGLVLLIPLVYVLVTLAHVERAAFGTTEAVRAAGRAFVLAPDRVTARQRAVEAARVSLADQGVDLNPADLVITCRPDPQRCLHPGSSIDVHLEMAVPLPLAPDVLGDPVASVSVEASHTEVYATYREAAP